ncbi:PorT family protein [Ancylomarina euxinus]|uniref:PorT family protein n=1 Tax=Ancylomarina euxinus TaxID=2283627 RepID=A0A425Y886_9BACT|nr:outer membrane beta-barrel protein [Ancylomarina euxinus]MCZ4693428.1 outer membrane beta-barrel protein [Ancylomarina euxinus]MUP13655.1 outer membrane beta-barrel protein [Ancylomarina euxinus]RRG24703.1 PorT family protein [Ancylomarina euxinus]
MKRYLLLTLVLILALGTQAQVVTDSLKTDSLKKKRIIIEDNWSNKKKKPVNKPEYRATEFKKKSTYSDTTEVKVLNKDFLKVVENSKGTKVSVRNFADFEDDSDTTKIRIGRKQINIIDGWHGTRIRIEKVRRWDEETKTYKKPSFRGHWSGFEMGINAFANSDYSNYPAKNNDFMDLNLAKSIAVNLNFLQYDISLQKTKTNIGLVTGMGLEWNNYRFDQNITLSEGDDGMIYPDPINPDWSVKKSKLTSLYLTVPLLMEFQIPVKNDHKIHMSAGLVGGLRLGTHTKIKYKRKGNTHKDKDRDDYNLQAFRYSAQVRLGYRAINLFASYGMTDFFRKNKGPELTPYTIGLTLVRF